MSDLTLQDWSAIAQIALTIATVTGVLASLFMSIRALREIQKDRRQRQQPHLAFESRGYRRDIEFVKAGYAIPGINPSYAAKVFSDIPKDAESVRIKDHKDRDGVEHPCFYGQLQNYGLGPALETRVAWVPETLTIGTESFSLNSEKLNEPRYSRNLNSLPPWATHIPPGEHTELTRLPTFIEKDFEKKVSQVEGVLEISCKDVFGSTHTVRQDFYVATEYAGAKPHVTLSFGSVRRAET